MYNCLFLISVINIYMMWWWFVLSWYWVQRPSPSKTAGFFEGYVLFPIWLGMLLWPVRRLSQVRYVFLDMLWQEHPRIITADFFICPAVCRMMKGEMFFSLRILIAVYQTNDIGTCNNNLFQKLVQTDLNQMGKKTTPLYISPAVSGPSCRLRKWWCLLRSSYCAKAIMR